VAKATIEVLRGSRAGLETIALLKGLAEAKGRGTTVAAWAAGVQAAMLASANPRMTDTTGLNSRGMAITYIVRPPG
jgi:hypothetical protein